MLGGDAQPAERANEFSNFSDAELLAELDRVAIELGIETTLMLQPIEPKRDDNSDSPQVTLWWSPS